MSAKGKAVLLGKEKGVALHPFVNVAHSFGDLWSYKEEHDSYMVSPIPDVQEYKSNPKDSLLIVASDGLWDVFEAQEAVDFVQSIQQVEVANGQWEYRPLLVAKAVIILEALRWWQHKKSKQVI